ncbi:MAG: PIG-L family deacetylase [Chloroflexi bacterium]|nr:PIG-L family deacetylase [Chloroflexota bacterium]MCI0580792.1 PIG-L family deacetylase [Chloroflexota bacterium]MCI0647301.1 PIG-L family deacetylase [Chloroflexota bacterium]MCI0726947.1 PIG-L family deacetylase [Chloroflexota bacterium]
MSEPLRLMCVLAHPDDESLGTGGTLAYYAAEGVETYLVTATRGERGWQRPPAEYPGPEALGRIREAELMAAARVLGLREVSFLDYMDGDLDRADPAGVVGKIAGHLRRVRPQVVVTFSLDGAYGHPDHIAISQFTLAALVCAADEQYHHPAGLAPHRVAKCYYKVWTAAENDLYRATLGDMAFPVDDQERRVVDWPAWAITTSIDARAHWETVWQAVACHGSQLPGYEALTRLPAEMHREIWGRQSFCRVYSLVNGGRRLETDLFEGLR